MAIKNNTLIRSGDFAGYTRVRYICENAPGYGSTKSRGGHTYEAWNFGNAAGGRWMQHLRAHICEKCGGRVIPLDQWNKPKEVQNA